MLKNVDAIIAKITLYENKGIVDTLKIDLECLESYTILKHKIL